MELLAELQSCDETGAFYEVVGPAGNVVMYVATHAYQQPDGSWAPKTPAGTYICQRGQHTIPNGQTYNTFEVLNVPGHSGILFPHPGNFPQVDSIGCFICGTAIGTLEGIPAVLQSDIAFEAFAKYAASVNQITLTIQ